MSRSRFVVFDLTEGTIVGEASEFDAQGFYQFSNGRKFKERPGQRKKKAPFDDSDDGGVVVGPGNPTGPTNPGNPTGPTGPTAPTYFPNCLPWDDNGPVWNDAGPGWCDGVNS